MQKSRQEHLLEMYVKEFYSTARCTNNNLESSQEPLRNVCNNMAEERAVEFQVIQKKRNSLVELEFVRRNRTIIVSKKRVRVM